MLKNSVMAKTFDDYILAVRSKYEVEKSKVYSGFLLKPSPAQLRDLCLILHDKGLCKKDQEVFELFFKTKPDIQLRKAIETIDVEKLRKICNFLNGKSQSTSQNSLNLIAILVNYEYRPFSLFLVSDINLEKEDKIATSKSNMGLEILEVDAPQKPLPTAQIRKKIAIGFLGLIGLISIGFTAKTLLAPEPQCMQWQKNHYEVVDCTNENEQQGLFYHNESIPFDEHQSQLLKIEVSDTTTFFKNGKAVLWYCKVEGKPEFFNTHGVHPETGKALKPVSEYIVNKYVKRVN